MQIFARYARIFQACGVDSWTWRVGPGPKRVTAERLSSRDSYYRDNHRHESPRVDSN